MESILRYSSELYAFHYFGIIIVVSLLECVVPRREAGDALQLRWLGNFGLAILDTFLLRLLFPIVGFGWAVLCAERGWGLFNLIIIPGSLAFVLSVLALDAATYGQHYLLHRVPLLWRLHRTHHSDHDCDFSTAARFHPLESVYTTTMLTGAIGLLGAPPAAVLVSQLLSTVVGFVEHGNVRMPQALDSFLRWFVVTPDMHRLHHSADVSETNSNFGTAFPVWDVLFGTYRAQPAAGHECVKFGLAEFADRKHLHLRWMLAQPFLTVQPATATKSEERP